MPSTEPFLEVFFFFLTILFLGSFSLRSIFTIFLGCAFCYLSAYFSKLIILSMDLSPNLDVLIGIGLGCGVSLIGLFWGDGHLDGRWRYEFDKLIEFYSTIFLIFCFIKKDWSSEVSFFLAPKVSPRMLIMGLEPYIFLRWRYSSLIILLCSNLESWDVSMFCRLRGGVSKTVEFWTGWFTYFVWVSFVVSGYAKTNYWGWILTTLSFFSSSVSVYLYT